MSIGCKLTGISGRDSGGAVTDTWLSRAIRRPGPSWKTGYPNATVRLLREIEGELKHSAEGSLSATLGVLDGNTQASWTFTVDFLDSNGDGIADIYQHYPLEWIPWHAGLPGDRKTDTSLIGNLTLVGQEYIGGGPNNPGEPLTELQYQACLYLSQETRRLCPRVNANPPTLRRNLWEHNWISSTSCPSGRIPWSRLIQDLEDEMAEMTDAEFERRFIKALKEVEFPAHDERAVGISKIRTVVRWMEEVHMNTVGIKEHDQLPHEPPETHDHELTATIRGRTDKA